MRPAVEKLREELHTPYPLASAKTWLAVEGRELLRKVEEKVGLHRRLRLVVIRDVVVNPLQRFGEPTTRGVPTEVIRELYVAGEPIEMIAELYQLPQHLVEAAVRYELKTAGAHAALAG